MIPAAPTLAWKPDWAEARRALTDWWAGRGLAISVIAPKEQPWEEIPAPVKPADPKDWWMDVTYWVQRAHRNMSRTYYGGVAFPAFNTTIGGAGSLGLFLGATGVPAETTLWYEPSIHDPATHPPLRFDPENAWWKLHIELLEQALGQSRGRYIVGFPDLIENIDTLAQLRESQVVLMDLVERPDWVKARLAEINAAFFECYDRLWEILRDPWGGSAFFAFQLWGAGRVCKIQCDLSCMISPAMFREFVVPGLTEQCERLDYTLYHLDGTQALHHLDALLEIEALAAIEWTPQAGLPGGGSPRWHDLYRRIKAAGKSVQAIGVKPDEIEPLIEAVGADGLYIHTRTPTEPAARALLNKFGWKPRS
ncbi:MAG: hypothetical protein PCFJNLEI_00574 [Verrucomicrobiae bacterium]|nr:hypothetical protein [Verrucomicrobiae bacterium]